MDEKEFKETIDQLKAQGLKEEDIMELFYEMYKEGKMDKEDFKKSAVAIGYEVNEELLDKEDGEEDDKVEEFEETEKDEKDDFEAKDKIEESTEEATDEDLKDPLGINKNVSKEKEDNDEKAEEEKAMKMFRV